MRGQIPIQEPDQVRRADIEEKTDYSKYRTEKEEADQRTKASSQNGNQDTRERKLEPIRVEKKAGRNDPCPCGSGKKYKNCHGR